MTHNPWLDHVRQGRDREFDLNGAALRTAERIAPNPDDFAAARDIAADLGGVPSMYTDNVDAWRRIVANNRKRDQYLRGSTSLIRWFNDPQNAAIAWDEVENLGFWGRLFREVDTNARIVRSAVPLFVGAGIEGIGDFIDKGGLLLAHTFGTDADVERYVAALQEDELRPASVFLGVGQDLVDLGESIAPEPEDRSIVGDVLDGLVQMGSQAAAFAMNRGMGALLLVGQGANIQAEQLRAAGVDLSSPEAAAAVIGGSAITSGTELLQIRRLMRLMPSEIQSAARGRLLRSLDAGAIEAGQEAAEGLLQDVLTNTVSDGGYEIGAGIIREAIAAGGAGAIARALVDAFVPGRVRTRLGGGVLGEEAAAETQGVVDRMDELARQSRLRPRAAEVFQDAIDTISQESGAVSLLVPSQRFAEHFRGRPHGEAVEFAARLGIGRQELQTALLAGADLSISMPAWATHIAGTPHHAGLRDHVRRQPEDPTPTEAAIRANAEVTTQLREEAERLRLEVENQEAGRMRDGMVVDDVRRRLSDADVADDVAESYATLWGAFFRVMAGRSRVDPFDLYQELTGGGLDVLGPIPSPLRQRPASALSAMVARVRGGEAAAASGRGLSLLDFLRNTGVRDEGGKLRFRDVDRDRLPDQPYVVRDDGLPLDRAAARAVEAGFFPELSGAVAQQGTGTADLVTPLLAAIDAELAGPPGFGGGPAFARHAEDAAAVDQLRDLIARLGIDLDALTNDQVAAELQRRLGKDGVLTQAGRLPTVANLSTDDQPGPLASFNELRAWAKRFYTENYQRRSVVNPSLGRVTFSALGKQKLGSSGASLERFRVLPALGEIIKRGTIVSTTANRDPDRKDRALRYHRIAARVRLDGHLYEATVTVEERRDGEFYYHLANPIAVMFQGRRPGSANSALTPREGRSGMGEVPTPVTLPSQAAEPLTDIVVSDGDDINLFLRPLDDDAGIEPLLSDASTRGSIRFPAGGLGSGDVQIRLSPSYDLSTFLHESGHFFLEAFRSLASRENAPADIVEDWRRIEQALGMEPGAATTSEQHERWARMTEAYFAEGRAPSIELQSVFERFRAWIISVYRRLVALNVDLTDEVRGVMDRMIATVDEIAEARRIAEMGPLFTAARDPGLSEGDWSAYRRVSAQAEEEGRRAVSAVLLHEMGRPRLDWWQQERAKIEERERETLLRSPLYRALDWMGNGRWIGEGQPEGLPSDLRLDRQTIVDGWGEATLRRLARGRRVVYSDEGGLPPDRAAGLFGFRSGDDMIRALTDAPSLSHAARQAAEAEMRRRHGDLLRDGSIEDVALKAAHGKARGEQLQMELRLLARSLGFEEAQVTTTRLAGELARQTIQRMRAQDAAQPDRYLAAERRAARNATQALARGRRAEAFRQKQRQLLAHYLWHETQAFRTRLEADRRFIDHIGRRLQRGELAEPYRRSLIGLMKQFDLLPRSRRDTRPTQSLADFVRRERAEGRGHLLNIDDRLIADRRRRHLMALTVEEIAGLMESIRNLLLLGRLRG